MTVMRDNKNHLPRQRQRRFVTVGLGSLLVVAGVILIVQRDDRVCHRLLIVGAEYADSTALAELARLDRAIDARLVADRIRRHPWIREAVGTCGKRGAVEVVVEERRPVLLVIGSDGAPSHYVDAEGYRMPIAEHPFDVPLLHGLEEAYHPVMQVKTEVVRQLAAAVGDLHDDADALISEFVITDNGVTLVTPVGGVEVLLGRDQLADRFRSLVAFWQQTVVGSHDRTIDMIDLRFDSQIITVESDG